MSDVSVPYQYGVVGFADSRRGDLLGLESGPTHLGPVRHDSVELEGGVRKLSMVLHPPPVSFPLCCTAIQRVLILWNCRSVALPVGAISG